jgi:putative DNA primase/helicase
VEKKTIQEILKNLNEDWQRAISPHSLPNAALEYYRAYGWYVTPLCWPNEDGECGCGKNHQGGNIGKAPILGGGYQNIRASKIDIKRWWVKWPQANIGILLEPSGLLVIDLDSKEAIKEALHLGLPPGPVAKTYKGEHRYYRSPKGVAGRATKRGDDRSIDILATGYIVAPPSLHRSGQRYSWIIAPK